MAGIEMETVAGAEGGGELTLAAMDEDGLMNIGQKTYQFVRRCMRDPELRARIKAMAAEIRASGEYA